ncbi:MAG: AAA family ATPase [Opitutaceae bacterium]|nr:AAA family ATPase [Opitutaceae bacterium]
MNTDTTLNHITVTIDKVASLCAVICKHNDTPFLLGGTGIGKTQVAGQYARSIGAHFFVIIAAQRDRLDIIGLPYGADDTKLGRVTRFAPDEFFAILSKERNPDGPVTVVLFDEINAAPDTVTPVLYRLFQERIAGDMTLRDNVHLMAAGNPASALSAGRDVQPVLKRRFVWLNVVTNVPVWTKWGSEHNVDGRVLTFLNNPSFSQFFYTFRPRERDRLTYATPDSWTKLGRALNDILALPDEETQQAAITGYVGQEEGTAFKGFLDLQSQIADPRKVLDDPENTTLPTQQDGLWLLLGGIINLATENPKVYGRAALRFCQRLFNEKTFADFGAFLCRTIASRPTVRPLLLKAPELDRLASVLAKKHPELLKALNALNEPVAKAA